MAELHLVCEGTSDGLDERVLVRVLVQILGVQITVQAGGGSSSLGSIRSYIEGRSRGLGGADSRPHAVVFSICDRDFEPIERVQAIWARNDRTLLLHRHEIENYLLEPRVVAGALRSFRETVRKGTWARALPTTEAEVSDLLRRAAETCLDAYVAGVVHRAIYVACREAGSLSFRLEKPKSITGERVRLDDWLRSFHMEAERLRKECAEVAGLTILEPDSIAVEFDAARKRVEDPAFFGEGRYLSEMEGKEIIDALLAEIHKLGQGKGPSREDLEQELVKALDPAYREGGLFEPDTFALLRDKLQAASAPRRRAKPG